MYCDAFWGLKWLGGRKYILVRWKKPKKSENEAIKRLVREAITMFAPFSSKKYCCHFFYQCSHFSPFLVVKKSRRQNVFMPVDVNSIVFVYLQSRNNLLFEVLLHGIFDLLYCNIMLLGMTWSACDSVNEKSLLFTTYPSFYLFNQTDQS